MAFQFWFNRRGDDNIKIQLFQNRVRCLCNDVITGFPDLLMCWSYRYILKAKITYRFITELLNFCKDLSVINCLIINISQPN